MPDVWIGGTLVSIPYGTSVVNGVVTTDPTQFPVSSGASAVVAQAANAAFNEAQASGGALSYSADTEKQILEAVKGATPASYAEYVNAAAKSAAITGLPAVPLGYAQQAAKTIYGSAQALASGAVQTSHGEALGMSPTYLTTPQGIVTIPAASSPMAQAYQNIALFGTGTPGVLASTPAGITNIVNYLTGKPAEKNLGSPISEYNVAAANQFAGISEDAATSRLVIPGAVGKTGELDTWAKAVNELPTRAAQEAYIARHDDPYARISYYSRFPMEPTVTAKDVVYGAMSSAAGIPGGITSLGDVTTSKVAGEYIQAGMTPWGAYALALETQRMNAPNERLASYYLNQEDIAKNFGVTMGAQAHYLEGKGWRPYAGNPWEAAADTYLESLKGYPTKGVISPLSYTTSLPMLEGKPVGSQEYAWQKAIGVDTNTPVESLVGTYIPSIVLAEARTGQIYEGIGIQSPLGAFQTVEGAQYRAGMAYAEQGGLRIEPTALSAPGAKTITIPWESMIAPSAAKPSESGLTFRGMNVVSLEKVNAPIPAQESQGVSISPTSMLMGVAGTVGPKAATYEMGYATLGAEETFSAGAGLRLGIGELIASNPIGWGAGAGLTAVLALEKVGALGLTGPTTGLSARTIGEKVGAASYRAGYEFGGATMQLSRSMQAAPATVYASIFQPEIVASKQPSTIEVIPSTIPTSELSVKLPSMIEVIPATLPAAELPAKLPSMIELQVYKPQSSSKTAVATPTDYASKLRQDYEQTQKNPTRFYDELGYAFPGSTPTRTPVETPPVETPTRNPYQTPVETPPHTPTELPTKTPTMTPYVFPATFPTSYPTPTTPGKPVTRLPEIKLTGLPGFGGLGGGGGTSGGAKGARFGAFAERFNVGQGIIEGRFLGDGILRSAQKRSIKFGRR